MQAGSTGPWVITHGRVVLIQLQGPESMTESMCMLLRAAGQASPLFGAGFLCKAVLCALGEATDAFLAEYFQARQAGGNFNISDDSMPPRGVLRYAADLQPHAPVSQNPAAAHVAARPIGASGAAAPAVYFFNGLRGDLFRLLVHTCTARLGADALTLLGATIMEVLACDPQFDAQPQPPIDSSCPSVRRALAQHAAEARGAARGMGAGGGEEPRPSPGEVCHAGAAQGAPPEASSAQPPPGEVLGVFVARTDAVLGPGPAVPEPGQHIDADGPQHCK